MDKKGTIFNIQRFCIHDGPGIRTTVFLKGCPLSCLWCHNPESKKTSVQLSYQKDLCTNCKACAQKCPNEAHCFDSGIHTVDFTKCIACGKCVDICPNNALELIGYEICADEILQTVLKDIDYYESSGGGITISGGEPLLQPEFLLSILKKSKENNLHTCVETCGFASEDTFKKIIDYVDLFLFDFKLYDENLHIKYTGVPSSPIQKNLMLLNETNAKVILRCPIIPNINDNLEHFKAIADLSTLNCIQNVEIMPYHTMGAKKSEKIGIDYTLDTPFATKENSQRWFDILTDLNCQKLVNPNL